MKLKLALAFLAISMHGLAQLPFQNPALSFNDRANDLLSRLTLPEKTSLLLYNSPAIPRLQIPEYNWWNEALHGVARSGKATVFPQAIGMAATFNPALIQEVANAISDEARAKHNAAVKLGSRAQYSGLSFWTPNINIFRDPRWGRGQETYGEDPYLTSIMGLAFVKGLQGSDPNYLKTGACAKHYVVHSGPEPLRHEFNAKPSETDFRETYLPAFRALVEGGVQSVMGAYNRVYDEPSCGSKALLQDILRKELGFKGQLVTDCWAVADFTTGHKVTKSDTEASAMAIKAGINLECGSSFYKLNDAVAANLITEADIDSALRPTLLLRFKLGLLNPDERCPFSDIPAEVVGSAHNKSIARQTAAEGMVLLKNSDGVLPLKNSYRKVLVTGPTAANVDLLYGNYNGLSSEPVTLLDGIMKKINPGTTIEYKAGCELAAYNGHCPGMASEADVTIACVGITPQMEGEEGDAYLSDSNGDRKNIGLPESQLKFLRDLRKKSAGKPLVVVVTGGSAIAMPEVDSLADAVVLAWYPGEQGGNALADILFGDVNPSGRLPITFYRSVADLPAFEDYSMKGRTYRYFNGKPLYPFGYGLSYTMFAYADISTSKPQYKADETIQLSCTVANTGSRDGHEVVQVYVKDSKVDGPHKALKGIQKIFLKKGESKLVTFTIPVKELAHWSSAKHAYAVEKGTYTLQVGTSSADIELERVVGIK
jgi:beta-glucosidase